VRGLRWLATLLALAGAAFLAVAVSQGSVHAGFLFVIPYVQGTGVAAFLGILLLAASGVAFFASLAGPPPARADAGPMDHVERRSGGVVLLGPIPIAWGSDHRVRRAMLVIGATMLALWVLVLLLTRP
jgi:uncharacterized membrane protein